MPHINDAGLALIESFEGQRLRAYPDPGTGGEPFTIGFGHTACVHPGDTCTQAQAIAFLRVDVGNAESAVAKAIAVQLTPNQFAALVSWQFNTGAIFGSTVAAKMNVRDFNGAMDHLVLYVYAGGGVLQGLVRRRQAERTLFFTA